MRRLRVMGAAEGWQVGLARVLASCCLRLIIRCFMVFMLLFFLVGGMSEVYIDELIIYGKYIVIEALDRIEFINL